MLLQTLGSAAFVWALYGLISLQALEYVAKPRGMDKVLVFDCDVHQGDGTAN